MGKQQRQQQQQHCRPLLPLPLLPFHPHCCCSLLDFFSFFSSSSPPPPSPSPPADATPTPPGNASLPPSLPHSLLLPSPPHIATPPLQSPSLPPSLSLLLHTHHAPVAGLQQGRQYGQKQSRPPRIRTRAQPPFLAGVEGGRKGSACVRIGDRLGGGGCEVRRWW